MSGVTEFRYTERKQRAATMRHGIVLAIFTILLDIFHIFSIYPPNAALKYTIYAICLVATLLIIYLWSKTNSYLININFDLFGGFSMIFCLEMIRRVIVTQSYVLEWKPVAATTVNYSLGAVFGALFFPANFRSYAICLAVYAISFHFAMHNLDVANTIEKSFGYGAFFPILMLSMYQSWALERKARQNFDLNEDLNIEKIRSEQILHNILPKEVADRIKSGESVADSFADATVIFVDLVGSSVLARNLPPRQFLGILNDVFAIADAISSEFGIEKVKTIGDAYLAVSGARVAGNAICAVNFSLKILSAIRQLAKDRDLELSVRIGIHSGPVIGGVIGETRATYDYWGDTMNVAARVESAAIPGGIAVTVQTYYATRDIIPYHPARSVNLKGVGEFELFDVVISADGDTQ